MNLSKPTNDKAEVLLKAIKTGYVDCIQFSWMEGFRTRVSNLKLDHKIPFAPELVHKKNRHGRLVTFKRHHLKPANRDFAIKIYQQINKTA